MVAVLHILRITSMIVEMYKHNRCMIILFILRVIKSIIYELYIYINITTINN